MIYRVTLIAKEIYEVEADNEKEAVDWAYELANQDPFVFETVETAEVEFIRH